MTLVTSLRICGLALVALIGAQSSCRREDTRGAAVDSGLQRDTAEAIQTDRLTYILTRRSMGWETTIPFTFRNRTSDTVYLVWCNGSLEMLIQERSPTGWTHFWGPFVPDCLSPPPTIAPGSTWNDTLRVWGAIPNTMLPAFPDTTFAGVYRLVWNNPVLAFGSGRNGNGIPLPLEQRTSNSFSLRRAP